MRTNPLSRLFLQLFVIIGASGVVAWIFTRCGQTAVIGEMVAGILLGPSLFGLLAPNAFQFIFAPSSLEALRLLSQIGVCLFLFTVGMELDVSEVRHKAQTAVVVSHSSIVIPYFLGVALALFLYSQLAQPGASFLAFALFMGISMSITAFPVLVRILQDRGIFKTSARKHRHGLRCRGRRDCMVRARIRGGYRASNQCRWSSLQPRSGTGLYRPHAVRDQTKAANLAWIPSFGTS